jgi:hypothetical protein
MKGAIVARMQRPSVKHNEPAQLSGKMPPGALQKPFRRT